MGAAAGARGALWETAGSHATFLAGAAFTAIGLLATTAILRK
jgi:hypothetical protein